MTKPSPGSQTSCVYCIWLQLVYSDTDKPLLRRICSALDICLFDISAHRANYCHDVPDTTPQKCLGKGARQKKTLALAPFCNPIRARPIGKLTHHHLWQLTEAEQQWTLGYQLHACATAQAIFVCRLYEDTRKVSQLIRLYRALLLQLKSSMYTCEWSRFKLIVLGV